ncbi:unnamed protein product, partial [Polarella glacialis]
MGGLLATSFTPSERRMEGSASTSCGSSNPTRVSEARGDCHRSGTELQKASTRCALLGSFAAVLAAAGGSGPEFALLGHSRLELVAVVCISASLSLEAITCWQRRCNRTVPQCPHQPRDHSPDVSTEREQSGVSRAESDSSPAFLLQQVLPVLRLLGLAAMAMGFFTALGAGAAQRLGIVPRTWSGLPGILFGCFVHSSWPHCGWNVLGLLLLGPCVLFAAPAGAAARGSEQIDCSVLSTGVSKLAAASAFIAVTSGLCVWCLARPAVHAGASGVVCGYVGLLLALTLRRGDLPLGSLLM